MDLAHLLGAIIVLCFQQIIIVLKKKPGSNVFFSDNRGKEVCGRATCLKCRSRHGDMDGKYANICLDYVSKQIIEKNNSTTKKV